MLSRLRRRRRSTVPAAGVGLVLMYHGVGEVDIDPWGLFVSPDNFTAHLEVLNRETRPMTLTALATAAREERSLNGEPRPAVAVTSDDGYANIATTAKPLLERHDVPATLFAISAPLTEGGEYWWDELESIVLQPGTLPDRLDIEAAGHRLSMALDDAATYTSAQWRTDRRFRDGDRPGARMALYLRLWADLRDLDHDTRRGLLDRLRVWAGRPSTPRESHRNLTVEELTALDGGLVTVGGHTVTHPILPEISFRRQRREILDNRRHLESLLNRPVDVFSYPFGAHSNETVVAARTAGYHLAVTTRPAQVAATTDHLRIGRFDVKNWDGDQFARKLDEWWRS